MRFVILFFCMLLHVNSLSAQDGKGFSVVIEASYKKSPKPAIVLTWEKDDRAQSYGIFRKDPQVNSWQDQSEWGSAIETLGKDALSFTDEDIEIGKAYEYQVLKNCTPATPKFINIPGGNDSVTSYLGSGYVLAGIDVPPLTYRGTVILLIDTTMVIPLATEIERLEKDLTSELWKVIKRTAPRANVFDPQAIEQTKNIIRSIVENNINEQYSILLIGRIPVPYTGLMAPDGHVPDHLGAWPADGYYADFDGNWDDVSINNSGASREENKNVAGDGKFDKSQFDIDIRIPVGRVDCYNLTSFSENETMLLKRYLDKNHAFRSGEIKPVYEATVDDNFGAYGEGFSGSAYRGFGALVGKSNIIANREFLDSTKTIMFSYACGAGSYTSCSGVGAIADFSKRPITSVFASIFGSYFGDWDSKDNVLRSVLASRGTVLTTGWAARPSWFFHPMGLGRPIGDVLLGAQNNTQQYIPPVYYTKKYPGGVLNHEGARGTHISLMGDPTLRMTSNLPIAAPKNVVSVSGTKDVQVTWDPVPGVSGYMVYRSSDGGGDIFELLTTIPVTQTTYVDMTTRIGSNIAYHVRSVVLRETKSGSFYEASTSGLSNRLTVSIDESEAKEIRIMCAPNPMSYSGSIQFVAPHAVQAEVSIHSMDGRLMKTLLKSRIDGGGHSLMVPAQELPIGMYMVRMIMDGKSIATPLIISR
ncbi:MAG: T9SS type A sorting domain-containing protein [Ignavibacteria bacterium]|nr:T9SS type A sorting domain-containing protein [Ignavibacteria bacterium]